MKPLETPEATVARIIPESPLMRTIAGNVVRADREAIAARLSAAIESADPFPALRALLAEIGGPK